jgi:DNA-binding NarL/FixJ family response regulator
VSRRARRPIRPHGSGPITASVVVGGPLSRTLARIVAQDRHIELLRVCRRSAELLRAVEARHPDVLLLAARSAQSGLVSLLQEIHAHCNTRILILTDRRDPEFIETILRYGVKGCVRTRSAGHHVVKAIASVRAGDFWLERKVLAEALAVLITELDMDRAAEIQIGRSNHVWLTNREGEIVALLTQGLTNKGIAKALDISAETVKKHLKNIFAKFGVHRRTQLVRRQLLGS